jgi:hypothetical protein
MIITLWNRLFDHNGTEREVSWPELVELLTARAEFRGGDMHPGWSPVRLAPCVRASENVRQVFALCLDFDEGEELQAAVLRAKKLGRGVMHTTRKHQRDGNGDRFRIVLELSRPVSPFEFAELWKRVAPAAGNVDPAPKDASRFWFLPGTTGNQEFLARDWEGEPLDVDAWLAKADPAAARPEATVSRAARADVEERARKYVAKMDPAIAGQKGHRATWDVALVLMRGFSLTEDRAYAVLCEYNTRCDPPWSERELRHKLDGAAKSEKVPRGFLLDRPDEWRTYKTRMPEVPPDDGFASEPPESWDDAHDIVESDTVALGASTREPGDDTEEPAANPTSEERFGVVDIRTLCFEVLSAVNAGVSGRGHTTGNEELDLLLCGLRPGMVGLLAAGTSWGKSSWGIMVADENLRVNVPVLVISVEDARLTYGKRIVARRSGVNAIRIRNNDCDADDKRKIERVAFTAPSDPFYLSAIGKTVEWAAEAVAAICKERAIGVIICDYVQRFKSAKNFGGDRRSQVSYAAEVLSDAGRNGGAHTVLLSQLKRIEGREPTMDDVKESGDLENMADHVMLGHRMPTGARYNQGEERPMKRVIKVPKNKDGITHTDEWLEMPFDPVTASFVATTNASKMIQAQRDAERALGA